MSVWAFNELVSAFRKEESPQRLIEFLDEELGQTNQLGQQNQNQTNLFSRYQGQREVIELPVYPPVTLISFPQNVYSQLQMPTQVESRSSYRKLEGKASNPNGQAAKLAARKSVIAAKTAKDPTLKALLQLKYFYRA